LPLDKHSAVVLQTRNRPVKQLIWRRSEEGAILRLREKRGFENIKIANRDMAVQAWLG